ncbi:MAG: phosphoribosylamine--glycine ligase [Candidatus Kapabacteria bacterium]|nr:phosphoribosylamine--glycine ligase [Candidatus Kapabacteria bacterium]
MERILLIGSGGREHALAKALVASTSCEKLWAAPGNPGIEREAECVKVNVADHEAVAKFCLKNDVSLVVIGPEGPLAEGLADFLRDENIDVFGPSQAAAQLETSKGFSKDFMLKHHIPTAPFRRFSPKERAAALDHVRIHVLPVVIKYDGLAAGKGVVVATTRDEALIAVNDMFDGAFGNDGIVIEGFLTGEEASVFAICDGRDFVVLAPAQDHKRIGDGDTGKNTGGMGAYAPAAIVSADIMATVRTRIIKPVLDGMREEGSPFVGCLFVGLMIDGDEVHVVEFNARFGDPETQAVMSVLDADVAALFASAARGAIDAATIRKVAMGFACNVVLASKGYPEDYEKGLPIAGIDEAEADPHVTVYHAGTTRTGDSVVTNGGRVLGVTATADTLKNAVARAYDACAKISYASKVNRTDIAARAL